MTTPPKSQAELLQENADLRVRLEEAEETLRAIRSGEVDALVVGEEVYTLKGAETPYRVLIEQMYEGAGTLLDDGTLLYANRRLAEMLHIPLSELIGASLRRFVAPTEVPAFDQLLASSKRSSSKGEFILQCKNGSALPVQLSFSVVFEQDTCPICVVATDLSERKRAEEVLQEQVQDFRTLAEAMPQIVWATRPDGWNVYFNQQWVDYTGMTMEESYGHGWNKPFHPEDKQRAWDAWQRATQNNERYSLECRLRRHDGVYRWWLIRGEPMRGPNGEILKWFGTCTDIEDLKRAEAALQEANDLLEFRVAERTAALQESEARFRLALHNAPVSVALQDRNLVYQWAYNQRTRWPDEIVGRTDADLFAPEDVPGILEVKRRVLETGTEAHVQQWLTSNGRRLFLDQYYEPTRDAAGEIIGIGIAVVDLTERKLAEEALTLAQRQVQSIIDNTTALIYAFDLEERFLLANTALAELLSSTPERMIGKRRHEFMPKEDADWHEANDRQVIEAGSALEFEERSQLKGRSITWLTTKFPLRDAQGRIYAVAGISADVSERKRAEEVLARSKEELERLVSERTAKLQELVGELEHMSYSIIHDMRAPLRAMQGYAEMFAAACAGCQQQDAQRFLHRIRVATNRMDALITDALNYNKAVRQELPLAPVDLAALLRGMLDTYPEFQCSKAQIQVMGQLPMVMGNEAGLTQCFSNLLGNAVKFAKPGLKPDIRIWAETRKPSPLDTQPPPPLAGQSAVGPRTQSGLRTPHSPLIRVWVEDNGVGIPEPMLPRVFDMFSRGHNTYEGTGIGLALVRKVVERMGGSVGVESEEGQGSRFWLDLQPF